MNFYLKIFSDLSRENSVTSLEASYSESNIDVENHDDSGKTTDAEVLGLAN